ncbi:TonB-dependent receptor domain-containing protein [Idiomarina aminovorans]|uniref:TonB-dependent receptor domain-containing protein n=1 Tax=Idiomarina aminovorans TaxID=2914829 RepID=UPI002005A93E|nr:TonB-dependent receptor [Idiomarina sp. ATCH4]MCK7460102.1 TonB-dependent receptor [Idiomarina sp. ATCH4]
MPSGTRPSALCIAIITAFSGHAQEHKPVPDEMEKIEVIGHKLSLVNQDIAASVSVLSATEIERNQEAELTNLLKELPGVEMNGSVSPLSGQPAIRGLYGERIHVSVDNVKRKTESDGTNNIATINSLGIDPGQLKFVQVLRGADSLTVGSGAVGGSIRLVTKDAADYLSKQPGTGARLSSSYQSATDALVLGISAFQLSDSLDSVFHASQVSFSDVDIVGDRDADSDAVAGINKLKNDSTRKNLSLKSTWQAATDHRVKGKIDWSDTRSNDQPYGQRQDLALAYPTLSENYQNDYLEASVNYSFRPDNNWIDLDVQSMYAKKTNQKKTRGYIPIGDGRKSFDEDSNWDSRRKGIRIGNLSYFTGVIDHKLAIEFDYEREDFIQNKIELSGDTPQAGTFYGDSDATNLSVSVIDQAELFNDRLLVTLGGRYDNYKRNNNYFADYSGNDDGEFSSELGLTFRLTDYLNTYIKLAEAFRAPSVQELYKKDEWRCHIGGKICYQEPQPDLKPETSDNIELGFGLHWENLSYADYFSTKVIYFDNEIENYIDNVPFMYYIDNDGVKQPGSPGPAPANGVPVATHRDYSAKNISILQSKGFEAEIDYRFGDLHAYIGYSAINMDVFGVPNFFLGKVEQQWQPYTEAPADKLTVNLNYQVHDELNLGAQLLSYASQKRLPELYLNSGYGTEDYQVVNLNMSYTPLLIEGLTLVAGLDNLTDERYLRAPASEASDPAEVGRNVKLSLHYQF